MTDFTFWFLGASLAVVLCACSRSSSDPSRKLLLREATDSSVLTRRGAVRGLGHLQNVDDGVIRALIDATADSDDSVRTLAVLGLGQQGPFARSSLPRIRELASHSGPQRATALLVLPNIDTETRSFANFYFAVLNDADPRLREVALSSLLSAGAERDAVPLLVKGLSDSVPAVRLAAARALAPEAHHDSIAYRAMTGLRHSSDSLARRLADSVLENTSPPR
jgi:HEAT repeat protein